MANFYGKDGKVSVEAFYKRVGGRVYRNVGIYTKGTRIDFGDYLVDSDEKAIKKAAKALAEAVDIMNDYQKRK